MLQLPLPAPQPKYETCINLGVNPKQEDYFNTVFDRCEELNQYNYFAYGGAIRGGKTYVTLAVLIALANKYRGSRWHVVREDMPQLIDTTIPSFEKLISGCPKWRMVRQPGNFHAVNTRGSKIFFTGQNILHDPELNSFLGLETNGFFLEQSDGLSEQMWNKALERTGSWYIKDMPPGFIFTTFNPTQNWVKQKFYEPWVAGTLQQPYFFQSALPKDNPLVTTGQWAQWQNMADRYRLQFIEGDWTDFGDADNRWAFAFERNKHVGKPEPDISQMLYLSFDFNKNPICCSVIQHYNKQVRVLETIKLNNSDIHALCNHISAYYPNYTYIVTGDASGKNTSALVQDNLNYYRIIKQMLNLSDAQLKIPSVNPRLEDNQVLVNSLLGRYDVIIHEEKARALIYDMMNVKMLHDGSIMKANRNDPAQQADALDTFRYFCNTFMGWVLMGF